MESRRPFVGAPVAPPQRSNGDNGQAAELRLAQPAATRRARPLVVVVGAGFGGLSVARTLGATGVDVLLVDRNNYHGFWPLLYQVATAGLEPEAIAYPVRAIVRKHGNVDFRMAEVTGVDLEQHRLLTNGEPIKYDYLVLSAGSTNNYFGNQSLAENTFAMKDIGDAELLRNHILRMFERASYEQDAARRAALMTMAVIGAGPTGVELAGALSELTRQVLHKDYPNLDMSLARVVLIEGLDRVLSTFPPGLSQRAQERLERMGIEVRLKTLVDGVENDSIKLKDGTSIAAATVIWAAGVRAADLAAALKVEQARGGRVKVEPTLTLPGHPEVFVIGDMAYLEGFDKSNAAYPMVAPVAIQMGEQAAKNILAQLAQRPMRTFSYFNKGQMATIGRRAAVLDAFGIRLSGRLAWLGWLFVHLLLLVGFRNRLIVLTNWAFNYFTYDRGVRLITGKE